MRCGNEEFLEEVTGILRRYGKVKIVRYPAKSRSFDVVATTRKGALAVKIVRKAEDAKRAEVDELKAFASTLSVTPLLVGEELRKRKLEDYIVYEYHELPLITPETLRCTLEDERIFIYSKRGAFYAKIDPQKLRMKREELGLSLGDLARLVGVTRKAIYEYERGHMDVSIDTALRFVEVLGEDVLKPIDALSFRPKNTVQSTTPDTEVERKILSLLSSLGYRVAHLRRTPVDIAASSDKRKVAVIVDHRERWFKTKAEDLAELREHVEVKAIAVVEGSEHEDYESLGFSVIRESELRNTRGLEVFGEAIEGSDNRETRRRKDNTTSEDNFPSD